MIPGLRALIGQLPDAPMPFAHTQFPFPVSEALFGAPPDVARIRAQADELEASEAGPQDAAWIALCAAEAVESVQPDRAQYFARDGPFRGAVFGGIKWRAGWALILGEGREPYARAFDAASFMV